MARRRRIPLERFKILNDFVDLGMAKLSRSEIAVYLILFRDTKPTGLARTSRTELARRGGMTERQASRALTKLIDRRAVHIVRRGIKGKAALYSLYPDDVLAEINPGLKSWIDGMVESPMMNNGTWVSQ
jgi:DNA-binding transcriptional ArsR family regulator